MTGPDIAGLRRVGKLAAETLLEIGPHIRPGITTEALNQLVHAFTLRRGARPAPLGYHGFPKSVCTSVNDVVCHGIPGPRVLEGGDIINVDVTTALPARNGWYGDTSATFYVGEPSLEARHVVEVARQALELGISVVRPGAHVGDIGAVIAEFAHAEGCSVVSAYAGHGIGRVFHGEPTISHIGEPGEGPRLKRGMAFTIEPMINLGAPDIEVLADDWTVVTRDGSLSAQFEHTILVTDRGYEVLTRREGPLVNSEDKPWSKLGPRACFIPPPG